MRVIVVRRRSCLLLGLFLAIVLYSFPVFSGRIPVKNSQLPSFKLDGSLSEPERRYLGIERLKKFSLDQINAPFLLIEIIGVYCPRCHQQAPLFNNLFHRIRKIPAIASKIKMMAIAAGANATELAFYKKMLKIEYPIVKDLRFEIHKQLGEPRTPFTMILTKEGKVLFTHLGVIKNMDEFLTRIRQLIR